MSTRYGTGSFAYGALARAKKAMVKPHVDVVRKRGKTEREKEKKIPLKTLNGRRTDQKEKMWVIFKGGRDLNYYTIKGMIRYFKMNNLHEMCKYEKEHIFLKNI